MPTPEHHAATLVQVSGLIAAFTAFIFSPVTWAGFIGAAIGVGFTSPKNYKEGLLWLAFGMLLSLGANAFLVNSIGSYASGLAAIVAMFAVIWRDEIVRVGRKILIRKGDQI